MESKITNVADKQNNRSTLIKLTIIAVGMFGFGFALVPFYKKICEVTGVNNLLQASAKPALSNTQVDLSHWITMQFDSNALNAPKWKLSPKQTQLKVHPGQLNYAYYEIQNLTNKKLVGQAIPSYAPAYSQPFFLKLECFCFKQLVLQPNEKRTVPVVFYLDHKIPKDISTITLAYSFFVVGGFEKQ